MGLSKEEIKSYLLSLPAEEQFNFLEELRDLASLSNAPKCKLSRREILDNKQGACPHCGHQYQIHDVKGGICPICSEKIKPKESK